MNGKLFALFFTIAVAFALVQTVQTLTPEEETFMKIILKCLKADDVGICLKWKAANGLKRLVETQEPLAFTDYLTLVKKPDSDNPKEAADEKRGLDLKSWESSDVKNEKLDEFIWSKLGSLLTTRTIQVNLPKPTIEGRGYLDKIFKKGHGVFLMAAMMGSMMMKLATAKVALIAGKALIIAKIALVLSLIIGLKKLLGRGDSNAEVVYSSAEEEANGWQRRLGFDPRRGDHAQNLAYGAYKMNQL